MELLSHNQSKALCTCSPCTPYVAKTKPRIRRGSRVYVYERENYRDSTGIVKHRNTRYLGIEVTLKGEKQINLPKKRFKEFEITKLVRYCDITVLYDLFKQYTAANRQLSLVFIN